MIWSNRIVAASVLNDCLGLYRLSAMRACYLVEVALIVRLLIDGDACDTGSWFKHPRRHDWFILGKWSLRMAHIYGWIRLT